MIVPNLFPDKPTIIYPDCDGELIADNTLQFRWIVTIEGGLDAMYRDDPNVFIAGDLLWYPVEPWESSRWNRHAKGHGSIKEQFNEGY